MTEKDLAINTALRVFRDNGWQIPEGSGIEAMYTRLFDRLSPLVIPDVAEELLNECQYRPKQSDVRKAINKVTAGGQQKPDKPVDLLAGRPIPDHTMLRFQQWVMVGVGQLIAGCHSMDATLAARSTWRKLMARRIVDGLKVWRDRYGIAAAETMLPDFKKMAKGD